MNEQLTFENRNELRNWLNINYNINNGIWIIFYKNNSKLKASEALEEALCFGWIDGQIKSIDEEKYIKKFTPRLSKSNWSVKNKQLVVELENRGLMTEAGRKAIYQAKLNGKWDEVKDSDLTDSDLNIFKNILKEYELAYSNYLKMSNSVQKIYAKHYFAAKLEDTKIKRLKQIIDRLNENKKPM